MEKKAGSDGDRPTSFQEESQKPNPTPVVSQAELESTARRATILNRVGSLLAVFFFGSFLFVLVCMGWFAFLWWGTTDNSVWHDIIIHDWAVRAISLPTSFLRIAIATQAGSCLSMLAALAVEKAIVPLPDVRGNDTATGTLLLSGNVQNTVLADIIISSQPAAVPFFCSYNPTAGISICQLPDSDVGATGFADDFTSPFPRIAYGGGLKSEFNDSDRKSRNGGAYLILNSTTTSNAATELSNNEGWADIGKVSDLEGDIALDIVVIDPKTTTFEPEIYGNFTAILQDKSSVIAESSDTDRSTVFRRNWQSALFAAVKSHLNGNTAFALQSVLTIIQTLAQIASEEFEGLDAILKVSKKIKSDREAVSHELTLLGVNKTCVGLQQQGGSTKLTPRNASGEDEDA
ncbi:hypothetical protein TWF694_007987 [Orbilia ellipsospora]|uniref:Uncharacterized protein n=1 Tax=Orbilia ellipsospora TaxID=2528407 RepID=A0AAV9XI43_9PEZI